MGTSAEPEDIAKQFASVYGCTVAITGAIDVVSDGCRAVTISNGDAMLAKVVGTGCIANVIVASFAAVNKDAFVASSAG